MSNSPLIYPLKIVPTITAGFLQTDSSGNITSTAVSPGALKIAVLTDVQISNVPGGNSVSLTWTGRNLNTAVDPSSIILNSASYTGISGTNADIQLGSGTYLIQAVAPFINIGGWTKLRFFNTTDSTVAIDGQTGQSGAGSNNNPLPLYGIFTIAATKTFQLQYNAFQAITNGLGQPDGILLTNEVYAMVTIQKIS